MRDKQIICGFACVIAIAGLAFAGVANAAPLEILGMSMQATPLFDANAGVQGEWDVPAAPTLNGFALDTDGNTFNVADLATFGDPNGTLSWSGNPLVADNSAGGLAAAEFGPGGTFSLSGSVRINFNFGFVDFSGLLISGTMSGFEVQEQQNAANFLDLLQNSTPILTPTGGAFFDGTLSTMPTDYAFNFSGAEVRQGGADLTDFSSGVQMVDVVNFNLYPVPEPSSLALFAGLAGLAMRRNRRR